MFRSMRSLHVGLLTIGACGVLSISGIAQQPPPGGGAPPVVGLTPAQQVAFDEGRRTFSKHYQVADGLGPVFNDEACNHCHRNGGGTNQTVRRFGRVDNRGVFDPLSELGGSLDPVTRDRFVELPADRLAQILAFLRSR